MTPRACYGSVAAMHVLITKKGVTVELTASETQYLIEELGELPSKGRPKVLQLHRELDHALTWRERGAVGHST